MDGDGGKEQKGIKYSKEEKEVCGIKRRERELKTGGRSEGGRER